MKLPKVGKIFQREFLASHKEKFAAIGVIALVVTLLLANLGDLLPGISLREANYALANDSFTDIFDPVNPVHGLLTWLSVTLFGGSAIALRLPSVLLAFVGVWFMYKMVSRWHGKSNGLIAIVILSTSSWFLSIARWGTASIESVVAPLALIWAWDSLIDEERQKGLGLFVPIAVIALSLYSPMLIYLAVILFILHFMEFIKMIKTMSILIRVMAFFTFMVAIAPLIVGLIFNGVLPWLGIENGIPSIKEFGLTLIESFKHIFWSASSFAELNIEKVPLLEIFTASMVALGLLKYERDNKPRSHMLLIGSGVLFIAIGLSQNIANTAVLLPIIYILAINGFILLYHQWRQIFPKNPVAHSIAFIPLAILFLFTIRYHLTRYYIAWPNNNQTQMVYKDHSRAIRDFIKDNKDITIVVPGSIAPIAKISTIEHQDSIEITNEIQGDTVLVVSSLAKKDELEGYTLDQTIYSPYDNSKLFKLYIKNNSN